MKIISNENTRDAVILIKIKEKLNGMSSMDEIQRIHMILWLLNGSNSQLMHETILSY